MSPYPVNMHCPCCRSQYTYKHIAKGEEARCRQCMCVLYRSQQMPNKHYCLPLALTAFIIFWIVQTHPVLYVHFHASHNTATMLQISSIFAQQAMLPLAITSVLLFIIFPLLQLLCFMWIFFFSYFNQRSPGFLGCMKLINLLRPWSMIEVAVLGILIAGIKLSHFLEIAPGTGCWAMLALMLLLTLLNQQNMHALWHLPEKSSVSKDIS